MAHVQRDVAVARGWRRAGMDRRMKKIEDDAQICRQALSTWRTAEEDLRGAAAAVSEELLRMRDVVCEVEDQGRLLQRYLDEVIHSSRRREQAEGMALRGHDGVSSLLPAPWWAHRGVQTEG